MHFVFVKFCVALFLLTIFGSLDGLHYFMWDSLSLPYNYFGSDRIRNLKKFILKIMKMRHKKCNINVHRICSSKISYINHIFQSLVLIMVHITRNTTAMGKKDVLNYYSQIKMEVKRFCQMSFIMFILYTIINVGFLNFIVNLHSAKLIFANRGLYYVASCKSP